MRNDSSDHAPRSSSWRRWIPRALIGLLLAVIGAGGSIIYQAASVSIQAEGNLHASLFAIRLVNRFVSEHGRWPRSWSELEGVSMHEGWMGGEWPASSPELQQRVFIDFGIKPIDVANQDPMSFTAIGPIGPYYEYRHYGDVQTLQHTIRTSINQNTRPDANASGSESRKDPSPVPNMP